MYLQLKPCSAMDKLIKWTGDQNPEKFVQKSVGNNLNDLYKDAPEKADHIISQWEKTGKSKAQDWIIKHGRRNQK